ncbi:prospero homeobox protein 1-like [Myripristis murdjan]|uniref:prospero homeobox protein 1-like n=1 Tax=Myripristis murdjan TaxID=586833 RepID=UPI001175F690|nr:prospero homeobox protein 1-like [Myripristis murdjan]
MYSSSDFYLDNYSTEHPSFQHESTVSSNSDGSSIFMLSPKDTGSNRIPPESACYSSNDTGSSMISSSQVGLNSKASRDGPVRPLSTRSHRSAAVESCGPSDWTLNSGHQAKRARVENIIKGMTGSPSLHFTDENKRTQELPLHRDHMQRSGAGSTSRRSQENQTIKKQLQSRHQPFRRLRTRFSHADGANETERVSRQGFAEDDYPTWSDSPNTSLSDAFTDPNECESASCKKYQGWKKVKLMNYFQSTPYKIKLMADILKYELSRAVSLSVDSIFKSMPLLQGPPNEEGRGETDMSLLNLQQQSSICKDNKPGISCCERAEVQVPDVQTEALSLVLQKPPLARCSTVNIQPKTRAHQCSKPPFSHYFALHEDHASENNGAHQITTTCLPDVHSGVGQAKLETFDVSWNAVKVRSKVNSRSVRSPQTHPVSVDPTLLEALCLPHVKIESDVQQSVMKNNFYMLNEGLTTNHLKKAKLMFFYTRYPSSLVLKTFFDDVQFTRCITSQLIKWFSNFREFYYIQMEKFARHAIMEGVADVRDLTVGRESELFRALNMHYNKSSDFQVPDRFIEVAEITLREFYIAISMGKDRDPSWKKAIYKVICKLDSDIPAEFKSHHCG